MPFACSICEEESTRICVRCTKDTCSNHLCDKCGCCSDCCGCEVPLDDRNHAEPMHVETVHPQPVQVVSEPMPTEILHGEPPPDPQPIQVASEPLRPEPEPLYPSEPTPEEILHVEPPRPDSEPQPPHPPPDPDPIPEDGPEPEPGPLVG